MSQPAATHRFTGWHMLAVTIGFFGVVLAVNLVMARYAMATFSGVVVENSYVASQKFNAWLAEARDQKALGWAVSVDIDAGRHAIVVPHRAGVALAGARVTAIASHPLGRIPDQALQFSRAADGRFVSTEALPAGRFLLRVRVTADGHDARFNAMIPA